MARKTTKIAEPQKKSLAKAAPKNTALAHELEQLNNNEPSTNVAGTSQPAANPKKPVDKAQPKFKAEKPAGKAKPKAETEKSAGKAKTKAKTEKSADKAKPKAEQPIKNYAEIKGAHFVQSVAVVGLQHLNQMPPLPCQDAAKAVTRPRSILLACDGAGSAAMSEVGSQALVTGITRLCQSIEPLIASLLDQPTAKQELESLVRVIVRHAMGLLQDLSEQQRRSIRDFRSTLNFALVGKEQTLWIKVGDGEIIQEQLLVTETAAGQQEYHSELSCLGDHNKGEFANQTQFIDDQLKFEQVYWGVIPSVHLSGLALMSDGAAEKLVAQDRSKVAGQISTWLAQLRTDKLKASELCKRFYAEDFCKQSTGDDRSIAMWARAIATE